MDTYERYLKEYEVLREEQWHSSRMSATLLGLATAYIGIVLATAMRGEGLCVGDGCFELTPWFYVLVPVPLVSVFGFLVLLNIQVALNDQLLLQLEVELYRIAEREEQSDDGDATVTYVVHDQRVPVPFSFHLNRLAWDFNVGGWKSGIAMVFFLLAILAVLGFEALVAFGAYRAGYESVALLSGSVFLVLFVIEFWLLIDATLGAEQRFRTEVADLPRTSGYWQ